MATLSGEQEKVIFRLCHNYPYSLERPHHDEVEACSRNRVAGMR